MAGLRGELQSPSKVQFAAGLADVQSPIPFLSTLQPSLASTRLLHSCLLRLTRLPQFRFLSCGHPAAACLACASCMGGLHSCCCPACRVAQRLLAQCSASRSYWLTCSSDSRPCMAAGWWQSASRMAA